MLDTAPLVEHGNSVLPSRGMRIPVSASDFHTSELRQCGTTFAGRPTLYLEEAAASKTFADFMVEKLLLVGNKALKRSGAETVLAMMRDLFVGAARFQAAGVPIRFINTMGVVQTGTTFKYSELGFAGADKYMHALVDDTVDIGEKNVPPEVLGWRKNPGSIPTSISPSMMSRGDVYALGKLLGMVLRIPSLFKPGESPILQSMTALHTSMVEESVARRPDAMEALSRYDAIMEVLTSDPDWSRRGEGTYACVGVQDDHNATKLFYDDISVKDVMDEVAVAKQLEAMDPDHVFTLATGTHPLVLERARFPGTTACSRGKKMGPYVLGLRMQAAAWALNRLNSAGARDVPDLNAFIRVQVSLFKGLVEFHRHGFVHHDIKPQNIVFDTSTKTLKFIDFGLSGAECYRDMLHSRTIYRYFAPEFLAGSRFDTPETFAEVALSLFSPETGAGVAVSATDEAAVASAWDIATLMNAACLRAGVPEWVRLPVWLPGPRRLDTAPDMTQVAAVAKDRLNPVPFHVYISAGKTKLNGWIKWALPSFQKDLFSLSDVFALGYSLMEVMLTTRSLSSASAHPKFRGLLALYRDMIELDASERITAEDALKAIMLLEAAP
jgi:hypothetical protein